MFVSQGLTSLYVDARAALSIDRTQNFLKTTALKMIRDLIVEGLA
jgi:hypothetical protein